MTSHRQIEAAATEAKLTEMIGRGSREPFRNALATALAGGPTSTDWQRLAADKPHLWAGALKALGEMSGYVSRSASVELHVDAAAVLRELLNRHGREQAGAMLEVLGWPSTLLPDIPNQQVTEPAQHETLDSEPVEPRK